MNHINIIILTVFITLLLVGGVYFALDKVQQKYEQGLMDGALTIIQNQNQELVWYYLEGNETVENLPLEDVCTQLNIQGGN